MGDIGVGDIDVYAIRVVVAVKLVSLHLVDKYVAVLVYYGHLHRIVPVGAGSGNQDNADGLNKSKEGNCVLLVATVAKMVILLHSNLE